MYQYNFSVSMCVYGGDNPEHFKEALESVYNQTLMPDEVVLVVDGPVPEKTNRIIVDYEKKKCIKVIRLCENVGHGKARNIGLENCIYEYVAIVDADDINTPDRFEKEIECFMKDASLAIVGSGVKHFIGDINNVVFVENNPLEDEDIRVFLKKRCPFAQATVMFKREAVIAAGGYMDWYYAEDYYLWIRMYLNGATFRNISRALVYVRGSDEQNRRRGGWRYFCSLTRLFNFMLKNNIIGIPLFLYNTSTRFVLQVLMPNKLRAIIRNKFI